MKLKKVIAAGLLATMITGLALTGCGNDDSNSGTPAGGSNENTPAENSGTTNDDPQSSGESETPLNSGSVKLPLTDEKVTLTIWTSNDTTLLNVCGGDFNNAPFFQELEERTNVHIKWNVPASGTEREQMNLMFSSGELPDVMYYTPGGLQYVDGLDAAIDDGYLLDLTPYMEEYAPNYMAAIRNGSEALQRTVKTDAGRYGCMYSIKQYEQPPFLGVMVRKDWLDELKLDMPETVDEWETVLTAFKEKKGAIAPLSVAAGNVWALGTGLEAYGNSWYQKDGKACYGVYSNPEACKEFLTILNRWYENGLMDPDFVTATEYFGDSVLVNNNNTGIFFSQYTFPSTMFKPAMDNGAEFAALLTFVRNKGDEIHYRFPNQITGSTYVISADCENPELAVQWIDYLFSEEGAMLANWGIEGETYTLDADGNPQFTDMVLDNPNGLNAEEALRYYTLSPGMSAAYTDYHRELSSIPESSIAMTEVWAQAESDYYYPSDARLNATENSEYSKIYSDISSYVEENTLAFITGDRSLDEFDDFIAALKSMNIERCIELKQQALDRYNSR